MTASLRRLRYGTTEEIAERQARAVESRRRNRVIGPEWGDKFRAKYGGESPSRIRNLLLNRWRIATDGRAAGTAAEEWCAARGVDLPEARRDGERGPDKAPRRKPVREVELHNVEAAALLAGQWAAWLLLVAGRNLPCNPLDISGCAA